MTSIQRGEIKMNVDNFVKGWLVGDFDPALIKSKNIEVGLKYYNAGATERRHVHNTVKEYTIVVSGCISMNDRTYGPGSIVEILPGISTDFKALEMTTTLVIKTPSIPSDKEFI